MTLTYSQFKGGRRYSQVFEYTGANQTWTRPTGVDFIESIILVAGGGGAESGCRDDGISETGGKGGEGGQTRIYRDVKVTDNLTIYVGKGGVGGVWDVGSPTTKVWGAAAEDSTVSGGGLPQTLTAYAGYRGTPEGNIGSFGGAIGGYGVGYGMSSAELLNCNAAGLEIHGSDGAGGDRTRGHAGGGSYSKGADGGDYTAGADATDGDDATGYGAGGGGGGAADTTGSYIPGDGGRGADGVCIITWWQ